MGESACEGVLGRAGLRLLSAKPPPVRLPPFMPKIAYSVYLTPRLGDAGETDVAYYKTVCAHGHTPNARSTRVVALLNPLQRSSGTTGARHMAAGLRAAGSRQGGQESNLQPPVLETGALPIELPPLVHRILSARRPGDLTPFRQRRFRQRARSLDLLGGAQEASTLARRALRAACRRLCGRRTVVGPGGAMDRARGFRRHRGLVLGTGLPDAQVSA